MKNTEINRTRLLEDPVGPTVLRLAVPMVFGILSMVAYNLADTFFVGRLGTQQLAALSFTFPVVLTISSLAQGIGMGTAAVVSRAIGAGEYERVRRVGTDSLLLGVLIVGVGAVAGILTIEPLFSALGAQGVVLDYIDEYMRIWYIGMVFVVVPMVGNNIIRATGDSRTPGTVMVVGAAANVVLDPVLIFGVGLIPAFGIQGAATATLIGRGITFFVAMYVLIVREKLLTAVIPSMREIGRSWREILHIGIPNATTRMIIPIGNGVITRIIAGYGAAAVAGYGVATRVEFFSLAALNALSSVLGPFVGQNLGAGKLGRVAEAFRFSLRFALAVGGAAFLIFLVWAPQIARAFNADPEVVASATRYLRVVAPAYGAQGFYLAASAGLNVMKRPLHAAGLSVVEVFVLAVPGALVGSWFFGLTGIYAAVAGAYALTGIIAYGTVKWSLGREVERS
ncbi:MAG: MATE family efflux transporter [Alkalispirochaeta sp.]